MSDTDHQPAVRSEVAQATARRAQRCENELARRELKVGDRVQFTYLGGPHLGTITTVVPGARVAVQEDNEEYRYIVPIERCQRAASGRGL
jgi:hypothetical protein